MFVTGHPGSTDRNDTVAELETLRDVIYPANIQVVKRRIGVLRQFATGGNEQARQAADITFSLENALKAYTGEYSGLLDQKIMNKKAADERALRDAVGRNPEWQKTYASAWDDISRAETANRRLYKLQRFGQVRGSGFAGIGLSIVRYVTEVKKPDGERLNGFHDAQLPAVLAASLRLCIRARGSVFADARQITEELGPENPRESGAGGSFTEGCGQGYRGRHEAADPRLQATQMAERRRQASTDPGIVMSRAIDPILRDTTALENEVTSVESVARQKTGGGASRYGTSSSSGRNIHAACRRQGQRIRDNGTRALQDDLAGRTTIGGLQRKLP